MDSAAVVMPQPSPLIPSRGSRISSNSVTVGRGRPAIGILSSGFCHQGHLQYYRSRDRRSPLLSMAVMAVINGKEDKGVKDRAAKKMKKKQQLKLLKELTRDLSTFSQMGFGLDSEAFADQVNRVMVSEAADVLLERLQKLRSEEKELKRKRKEEKARLKASQMQTRAVDCEESSSSSSESSCSKCDEVIDIKSFKHTHMEEQQNVLKQLTLDKENSLPPAPIASLINLPVQSHALQETNIAAVSPCCSKKIEVCMGGKCKKYGAAVLLEELRKAVGMEVEVSGCKCMGKCKEGPNVKVVNSGANSNSSAAQPQGALCKGVGVEDVDVIVSEFLVEDRMGFAAAA